MRLHPRILSRASKNFCVAVAFAVLGLGVFLSTPTPQKFVSMAGVYHASLSLLRSIGLEEEWQRWTVKVKPVDRNGSDVHDRTARDRIDQQAAVNVADSPLGTTVKRAFRPIANGFSR